MSIDELLRAELEVAVSTVPSVAPAPLGDVERRGRRRRVVARAAMATAGVAVFTAVVGVTLVVGRIGYMPEVADPTVPPATSIPAVDGEAVIAGEVFPVDGLVEAFAESPMYYGEPSPPPLFDVTSFGIELPLDFGQARVADPDVLNGPTIYLGEAGEWSVFVNQRPLEGGPGKCLWIGATPQLCGDSGAFELFIPPQAGPPTYGAWLGVPDGTSVVVLRSAGIAIAWQQPVGGVSLIELPAFGVFELAALDETGTELELVEVTAAPTVEQGGPVPGAPTTTLP